ncbi:MAG: methyltransferase domain-containing protein [Magnetococcales bacterium]|nr:methyltransferase domain-containing protein [Magnetococcales bacterium]
MDQETGYNITWSCTVKIPPFWSRMQAAIMEPTPLEQRPYARLDPRRVRRALGRAAHNPAEEMFGFIDRQLLERITEIRFAPERILEVARIPGECARLLQTQHPKARVITMGLVAPTRSLTSAWRLPWQRRPLVLQADPRRFPLPENHFDLAVCNMMLHWSSEPLITLREIRRVLKPGAPLLLATMGDASLTELKESLARIDQTRHGRTWIRVPEFHSLHDLGDLLASAGFSLPVVDRDLARPVLADVPDLLQRLRIMGATNAHRQRPAGLMGKGYPRQLAQIYTTLYGARDGSIPVTLEILFGHAWKKGAGHGVPSNSHR